jgi:hypothetical protein
MFGSIAQTPVNNDWKSLTYRIRKGENGNTELLDQSGIIWEMKHICNNTDMYWTLRKKSETSIKNFGEPSVLLPKKELDEPYDDVRGFVRHEENFMSHEVSYKGYARHSVGNNNESSGDYKSQRDDDYRGRNRRDTSKPREGNNWIQDDYNRGHQNESQDDYNNNRSQGDYDTRPQRGSNWSQDDYNNNRSQGDYDNRPQRGSNWSQDDYNNNRSQGDYDNRPQRGSNRSQNDYNGSQGDYRPNRGRQNTSNSEYNGSQRDHSRPRRGNSKPRRGKSKPRNGYENKNKNGP